MTFRHVIEGSLESQVDLIIQGLTKQFQNERGLTALREDEFDPDRFRTGPLTSSP